MHEPASRTVPVAGHQRHAFERLVLRHQNRIYSVALGILGDREAAKDVAQEAFCRALQGLRGFRRDASFSTWVSRITVNLCRSELRRSRVRGPPRLLSWLNGAGSVGPVGSSDDSEPSLADDSLTPDEVLTISERHQAVHREVAALRPDLRHVIVLTDMEGFTYQDAARLLEIPVGTVRSRLHRARRTLRARLSRWLED